ncbi:hypothetical protein [Corynebacterium oculi]|uniref:hypothetical protein n=1 Tax=Corynebacterium oculi TaxID=1544416 RepID=UPI0012372EE3|nr:hypothetical protein [Corynebacterium oculi]
MKVVILNPDRGRGNVFLSKDCIQLNFSKKFFLIPGTMEIVDSCNSWGVDEFIIRGEWEVEEKSIFRPSVTRREERDIRMTPYCFGNSNMEYIKSIIKGGILERENSI